VGGGEYDETEELLDEVEEEEDDEDELEEDDEDEDELDEDEEDELEVDDEVDEDSELRKRKAKPLKVSPGRVSLQIDEREDSRNGERSANGRWVDGGVSDERRSCLCSSGTGKGERRVEGDEGGGSEEGAAADISYRLSLWEGGRVDSRSSSSKVGVIGGARGCSVGRSGAVEGRE